MPNPALFTSPLLLQIYAPPFEAAVAAGVGSLMCSYNRITASTYTSEASWACENSDTLLTVLKERFGFEGWVMSDWFATHSTVKAALNGLDMEMPEGRFFGPALQAAVASGAVNESAVDDKVARLLAPLFALGIMDHLLPFGNHSSDVTSPEHTRLARDIAAASTVLLKNNAPPSSSFSSSGAGAAPLLPLDPALPLSVAVVGPCGDAEPITGGGGSGQVRAPVVSGLEGIREVVEAAGGTVAYFSTLDGDDADAATATVAAADAVVVFVGTTSSEGSDRPNLGLGGGQDELVLAAAALNPNTAVVVVSPGAALLGAWAGAVPAVLFTWMPGQEAGHAAADVLFGLADPAGRLAVTLPNTDNEVRRVRWPGQPISLW